MKMKNIDFCECQNINQFFDSLNRKKFSWNINHESSIGVSRCINNCNLFDSIWINKHMPQSCECSFDSHVIISFNSHLSCRFQVKRIRFVSREESSHREFWKSKFNIDLYLIFDFLVTVRKRSKFLTCSDLFNHGLKSSN